jgi:hypothetical protein
MIVPSSMIVASYELGRALRSFTLPPELREVSGITAIGVDTIACVQDELRCLKRSPS